MSQSPTFNEKIASFLENTPHLHALSISDEKGHLLGHEPKAAQTSMSTIQTFGHLTLQNRSTLLHSVHIQGNEGQWTGNRFTLDSNVFILWMWWDTTISSLEIQREITHIIDDLMPYLESAFLNEQRINVEGVL